jgi:hypothetical protein
LKKAEQEVILLLTWSFVSMFSSMPALIAQCWKGAEAPVLHLPALLQYFVSCGVMHGALQHLRMCMCSAGCGLTANLAGGIYMTCVQYCRLAFAMCCIRVHPCVKLAAFVLHLQAASFKDRWQRSHAEMQNLIARQAREKETMQTYAVQVSCNAAMAVGSASCQQRISGPMCVRCMASTSEAVRQHPHQVNSNGKSTHECGAQCSACSSRSACGAQELGRAVAAAAASCC